MNSPFAQCEATLVAEPQTVMFRNEEYLYEHRAYQCEQTLQRFTTTEMDEANTRQVYNQYRAKHNIPFEDEIRAFKEFYGLSAQKLSLILGFGENQIRSYLNGEIPNISNGKLLRAVQNPEVFKEYVEIAKGRLSDSVYQKLLQKAIVYKEMQHNPYYDIIFRKKERSVFNGYALQDLDKLADTIRYALYILGDTFKTKMNKILFYIDMCAYRQRALAVTGLAYKAERYGTIPFRSDKIYSLLNIPTIVLYTENGEYMPLHLDVAPTTTRLSEDERAIIKEVCQYFKSHTSQQISDLNHKETAWIEYKDRNTPIPFTEAFRIQQI